MALARETIFHERVVDGRSRIHVLRKAQQRIFGAIHNLLIELCRTT
jgi:hypothetical protein